MAARKRQPLSNSQIQNFIADLDNDGEDTGDSSDDSEFCKLFLCCIFNCLSVMGVLC